MSVDEKVLGLPLMRPQPVDMCSSCRALVSTDSRGTPKEMMTSGEVSLAQRTHLAAGGVNEEEDGPLGDRPLPTHTVILCNTLMLHTDKLKKDQEVDPDVHYKLYCTLAPPLQLPINVKQEVTVPDTGTEVKKETKQMNDLPENVKKKSRKQHNPAKILAVCSDGSLGLQTMKSHICQHCNATFRTNYHLQRHLFIHTGEKKPFQCSQCNMRFIQKYLLQRHEKIHSGKEGNGTNLVKVRSNFRKSSFFSRTDRVLKHKRMCHQDGDQKANRILPKDKILDSSEGHGLSFRPKESSLPKKRRKKSNQSCCGGAEVFPKNGETGDNVVQRLSKKGLPLYALSPAVMVNECMVAEYSVEQPPAVCPFPWGSSSTEINPPKVILKKVLCKKVQNEHSEQLEALSCDDAKATRFAFELVAKEGLLDGDTSTDPDPARNLREASHKRAVSSTNYDDAMQFLKKRRYLQGAATSNRRGGALNVGNMAPQPSVSQAPVPTITEERVPAVTLDAQNLNVGIKSNHEKNNFIPDEVLQTFLDHYSHKGNGQPPISFSVAKTEVISTEPVNSPVLSDASQADALGTNSEALPAEKLNVLQEYSKFLQQALERTSQNDLNNHSLTFATAGLNFSSQPFFSGLDKQAVASRFLYGMNSPLRSSSEKSHAGLLAADSQNCLSFSGDEMNASSASSSEDFLKKATSSNETDAQVIQQTFGTGTLEQNHHLQLQTLRAETSSQFTIIDRQVSLRGLANATVFPEFPLITLTKTRAQLTSSPDDISNQMFG
ncbi:zinc finger protein 148-like [Arapaima gigas]